MVPVPPGAPDATGGWLIWEEDNGFSVFQRQNETWRLLGTIGSGSVWLQASYLLTGCWGCNRWGRGMGYTMESRAQRLALSSWEPSNSPLPLISTGGACAFGASDALGNSGAACLQGCYLLTGCWGSNGWEASFFFFFIRVNVSFLRIILSKCTVPYIYKYNGEWKSSHVLLRFFCSLFSPQTWQLLSLFLFLPI